MLDDPVAFRSFVERQLELPLAEWAGKLPLYEALSY
jgi:hypothetical protein